MDRLIELVEILRLRRRYAGYLHAKAVAGAEPEQIDRLADLCDRVSYNLEAACQATLDRVAPEKSFEDGLALLRRVRDRSQALGTRRVGGDPRPPGRAAAAGTTAQFVVGIGSEADRNFLETSHRLWRERAFWAPFPEMAFWARNRAILRAIPASDGSLIPSTARAISSAAFHFGPPSLAWSTSKSRLPAWRPFLL